MIISDSMQNTLFILYESTYKRKEILIDLDTLIIAVDGNKKSIAKEKLENILNIIRKIYLENKSFDTENIIVTLNTDSNPVTINVSKKINAYYILKDFIEYA